jgi:hypothetical protein
VEASLAAAAGDEASMTTWVRFEIATSGLVVQPAMTDAAAITATKGVKLAIAVTIGPWSAIVSN